MASKLTGSEVARIGVQTSMISPPVDRTIQNIKNKVNEIIDELVALSVGATNAETTDARPYHASLKARLDSVWSGQFNYIKDGGVCTIDSDLIVSVTEGEAKVSGIDVKWSAGSTSPLILPVTNNRYDIVVINSDSSLSIATGSESANPVFPTVAETQRALAMIALTPSDAIVYDARTWGAYYWHDGAMKYQWKGQDAIDDLDDDLGGTIRFVGRFYEELDFSGKNNVISKGYDAIVYRTSATTSCIKSVNTSTNETTGNKWFGFDCRGNSKAGSLPLYEIDYTDEFIIQDCIGDGNASSSATGKDIEINQCDGFMLQSIKMASRSISNCTSELILGYDVRILNDLITNRVKTDLIEEKTANSGVDIDGVILKDGGINTDNINLRKLKVNIGVWDMDTTVGKSVSYGVNLGDSIRAIHVFINSNGTGGARETMLQSYIVDSGGTPVAGGSIFNIASTAFQMYRATGGHFDNSFFSGSDDRGYAIVEYEV